MDTFAPWMVVRGRAVTVYQIREDNSDAYLPPDLYWIARRFHRRLRFVVETDSDPDLRVIGETTWNVDGKHDIFVSSHPPNVIHAHASTSEEMFGAYMDGSTIKLSATVSPNMSVWTALQIYVWAHVRAGNASTTMGVKAPLGYFPRSHPILSKLLSDEVCKICNTCPPVSPIEIQYGLYSISFRSIYAESQPPDLAERLKDAIERAVPPDCRRGGVPLALQDSLFVVVGNARRTEGDAWSDVEWDESLVPIYLWRDETRGDREDPEVKAVTEATRNAVERLKREGRSRDEVVVSIAVAEDDHRRVFAYVLNELPLTGHRPELFTFGGTVARIGNWRKHPVSEAMRRACRSRLRGGVSV